MYSCLLKFTAPEKNFFSLGITSIATLKDNNLIIGTGEGVVQELKIECIKNKKKSISTLVKSK